MRVILRVICMDIVRLLGGGFAFGGLRGWPGGGLLGESLPLVRGQRVAVVGRGVVFVNFALSSRESAHPRVLPLVVADGGALVGGHAWPAFTLGFLAPHLLGWCDKY